jgi:hypothetical protein
MLKEEGERRARISINEALEKGPGAENRVCLERNMGQRVLFTHSLSIHSFSHCLSRVI